MCTAIWDSKGAGRRREGVAKGMRRHCGRQRQACKQICGREFRRSVSFRLRAPIRRESSRTMSNIQERLLESKMTDIEQARSWSPRVISKFETLIRSGDDLSLYRVNPLAFAR